MPDGAEPTGRGPLAAVDVGFDGTLRGTHVQGTGTLSVFAEMVELRERGAAGRDGHGGVWAASCADVQSLAASGSGHLIRLERLGHVTLHPAPGADAAALDAALAILLERCCTLPELTLALPGLGSSRAAGRAGDAHDRFFAPLLDARRQASRARGVERMLAALDARRIGRGVDEVLLAFARERNPGRDSARRAMEALLEDGIAPLHAALEAQAQAAEAVRLAQGSARLEPFRRWTDAVRRTFLRADECWRRVHTVLLTPYSARRSWL